MKKVFKSLFLGLVTVGMFFTGCQIDEESGNWAVLALAGSGGKTITGICFSEDCDLDSSAIGSRNDAQELTVGQTYPVELVYKYSDGSIGEDPIDLDEFIENDEFSIEVQSGKTNIISVNDDTDLYVKAATTKAVRVTITLGKYTAKYYCTATESPVPVLSKIEVVKTSYTLYESSAKSDRTFTVTAIYTDGSSDDVTKDSKTTVVSDNEEVATASNGVITVNGLGKATLTVTYESKTAEIKVTVLDEDDEVTEIAITNSTTATISYHSSVTLKTKAIYESGNEADLANTEVDYTITSGKAYATLSNGVLTNNNTSGSEQSVKVKASYDGFESEITFKLAAKVDEPYLELSTSDVSVQKGSSESFTVTYYTGADDEDGKDVTSQATAVSSNTSVATVSNGIITGVSAGSATITVTYNNLSETIAVTVSASGEGSATIGFDFN